ncbi:cytochrome c-type biogenesis protein [Saccharopolyspora griseoalba]|uniref:Cytochrome c-type biogenesis protein n=1 Tax=Saccharopolyspora griseoalba TaxID=1431848 RepID=A0ABW2LEE1_9PSEU
MRNRWSQAGVVGAILAALAVVAIGLLSGESAPADRALELERQLRCPVCKSVSVAESPSDTAEAMRRTVAEQIAAGRSDQQIVDYFRSRYGQWVLLDPPVRGSTLWVWLAPALVGVAGCALVLVRTRRRAPPAELAPETRQKVAAEVARVRASTAQEDDP